MAEKKEKKYVIDNARLMAEWDWEKNDKLGLDPHKMTCGSGKKAWWRCSKGHEWQSTIANRIKGAGCPCCSGRVAIKGENDLETVNPILSQEWNHDKNNGLLPAEVLPNSEKKVWWKCVKGHEWQATISSRNKGHGCPYCSGRFAINGVFDLQTLNPTLSLEWNYDKNNGLTPTEVLPNSNRKVWWKCRRGHEWQAKVSDRNRGNGCPVCNSERNTSFPEYAIVFYLKKCGLEVIHSYRGLGYELDIFVPSKKIAIEYDGQYWHKNKGQKDLEKNAKCEKDGIKLYRIREGLPQLNSSSIDYVVTENRKDISRILEVILSEIVETDVDVNLEKDAIEIENLREFTEKENSVLFLNPVISAQWNYERNGDLKPEFFAPNSDKKLWWRCDKGHEWQTSIGNRHRGNGCPYCSGRYAIKGETDLHTVNPTLSQEWNYLKNGNLKPEQFTAKSHKKVWWVCSEGHEWQAEINGRSRGNGCPYCAKQNYLKDGNDMCRVNPSLAREWNYEKNGELKPESFSANSHKKVWWKCGEGHEWQAAIYNRNNGRGCPVCARNKRKVNPHTSK